VAQVNEETIEEPSLQTGNSAAERLSREKRVLITPSEEHRLERLVIAMAERLKTTVKLSNLLRAAVVLLQEAEKEILHECEMTSHLKRPDNSSGEQLMVFDKALAEILKTAVTAR
jgi:hypothetical protein